MPTTSPVSPSRRRAPVFGALAFGLALAHVEPTRAQTDSDGATVAAVSTAAPATPPTGDPTPWTVSGFATLGAVYQRSATDWRFLRSSDQPGASGRLSLTPDSRVGAQLNWDPNPAWEGALQVVRASRPDDAPWTESVTYAYFGWRPTPGTRLRLGRTSPDLFLFADSRNVGYALPWVRPPVDYYSFVPLSSIDGVDFQQRWAGVDATWTTRVSAGQAQSAVTSFRGDRLPFRSRDALALGLSRESGGLTLKLSALRAHVRVDFGPEGDQLTQAVGDLTRLPIPGIADGIAALERDVWSRGRIGYVGLAAQYETGPWTWIAEGSRLWVPNSLLDARRGYVSIGYRRGPVTYYALASRVKPVAGAPSEPDLATPLTPVLGSATAQAAQALAGAATVAGNNSRADQGTIGLGLRWDVASNTALKLQVDRFDVRARGGANWRNYDGTAGTGTLWSAVLDVVLGQ